MHRRQLLELAARGSVATAALGAFGCAGSRRSAAPQRLSRPSLVLPPVRVAWDRVIRTTVGLRPHRPTGFVLAPDELGSKFVVHNYGHGGAGMSLSWGTGQAAAELALAARPAVKRAAVIGCGVAGLTSARQLQRRGFEVTIYAKDVPPNTTSNMAYAGFTPTSGLMSFRLRTPQFDAQFRAAVRIAYRELQLLAGPKYGISWLPTYTMTEDPRSASGSNPLLPEELHLEQRLLQPGEHPFPTTYVIERPLLRIEPSIYLNALVDDVLLRGGRIVLRQFEAKSELMTLEEPVIVNCTGLGAKALFNDDAMIPLKGQLTVLVPQGDVQYSTNGGLHTSTGQPGIGIHMLPRTDGIVLGGTSERQVWSLDVNVEERKRIVEAHKETFAAMWPSTRRAGVVS